MTIAGCDRVALGVQVVSSSEAHHLWRVWKACSEENVESDVHRPRKGGVRHRISPSKASKAIGVNSGPELGFSSGRRYSTPLADSYFYSCALPPLVLVLELLLYMCAGVSLSLSL